MNQSLMLIAFPVILLSIFFISRIVTDNMFHLLRIFIKNETTIFVLISLFFLPGTILHELAHFFAATILVLRVRSVSILPTQQEGYIKLGSVTYEKKDVVRGILVGIAPLFVGLIFFYLINASKIFPTPNFMLNVLFIYLIFSVSSTMFSSKQDLVDIIFVLPLGIIIGGIIYIFDIEIVNIFMNKTIMNAIISFVDSTNRYLFFSLLINLLLLVLFKGLRVVLRK